MPVILWFSVSTSPAFAMNLYDLNDKLSKEEINETIEKAIQTINMSYLFPEKSRLIEKALQRSAANESFDGTNDWYSLMKKMNTVIKHASEDIYLEVVESNHPLVIEQQPIEAAAFKRNMFNIGHVEILSDNIGYFNLKRFAQNPQAEHEVFQALQLLSDVDALIVDLRNSDGHSITLAHYIMSFFVQENTKLSAISYDKHSKTKTLKALATGGNEKFKQEFPLYILTSAFVANAGEFISYTLKHLDKAVIVGEETMGVAYIVQKQKINNYLSVSVPIAISNHPTTASHWEGVGVTPDVNIAQELALDYAHNMAKQYLNRFNN